MTPSTKAQTPSIIQGRANAACSAKSVHDRTARDCVSLKCGGADAALTAKSALGSLRTLWLFPLASFLAAAGEKVWTPNK
jgi:hypothetical protein